MFHEHFQKHKKKWKCINDKNYILAIRMKNREVKISKFLEISVIESVFL